MENTNTKHTRLNRKGKQIRDIKLSKKYFQYVYNIETITNSYQAYFLIKILNIENILGSTYY